MNWLDHSKLKGCHAFLSASKHSWLNYDEEVLKERFINSYNVSIGTIVHEFSEKRIRRKRKLKKTDIDTLLFYLEDKGIPDYVLSNIDIETIFFNTANYVNDAIAFGMDSEIVLYYSQYCYGTADSISFHKNKLRIHDLKTGFSNVSMDQLLIYAGIFCLEYNKDPKDLFIELRIYQNDDVLIFNPEVSEMHDVINRIVKNDNILNKFISGGLCDERTD